MAAGAVGAAVDGDAVPDLHLVPNTQKILTQNFPGRAQQRTASPRLLSRRNPSFLATPKT